MSKEIDRINYEFKKRDLTEKYSYAISHLGTCSDDEKDYWRQQLEQITDAQAKLTEEYNNGKR